MSQPISVDIFSDDDDDQNKPKNDPLSTPFPIQSKRQRTEPPFSNPTVLLIDDDHPTPLKRPSFVPETPISPFSNSDVAIVKCIKAPSAPYKFSDLFRTVRILTGATSSSTRPSPAEAVVAEAAGSPVVVVVVREDTVVVDVADVDDGTNVDDVDHGHDV
ncbi:hypothetical protein LOK49_LG06G02916 [Camellia lanceoleosa]|uniref:Uncharacterized protein n=1 Tax=Camellia lanceoleosa TaxID=1840588 RepID=A0ACC0H8U6_9ERIC|nr:hypothetical protein LOK49_LG06G02916 [Camellia lanceoleosa]